MPGGDDQGGGLQAHTGIHLVGEFPGWTTDRVIAAIAPLASRLRGWPLVRADDLGPFLARRGLDGIPTDAVAQLDRADVTDSVHGDATVLQIEFPIWDLVQRENGNPDCALRDQAVKRIAGLMPPAGQVALHLCAKDGARYVMSPADMAAMVDLSNRLITQHATRLVRLHFPTPLRHSDDAFFRPLAGLHPAARDRIALGIVHLSDGVEGALRRAALARPHLPRFDIATRCGFGARSDDDIAELLILLERVAAMLDQGA